MWGIGANEIKRRGGVGWGGGGAWRRLRRKCPKKRQWVSEKEDGWMDGWMEQV